MNGRLPLHAHDHVFETRENFSDICHMLAFFTCLAICFLIRFSFEFVSFSCKRRRAGFEKPAPRQIRRAKVLRLLMAMMLKVLQVQQQALPPPLSPPQLERIFRLWI